MARPRKPTNVLEFNGAFKKNPQRAAARANEPKDSPPINDGSPDWMNDDEKKAWRWVIAHAHPGVLTAADSGIVELTAQLRALVVAHIADSKDRAQLRTCYNDLGMTPASRSKVSAKPAEKEENEFAAV
jgi:phage terminase small subunit